MKVMNLTGPHYYHRISVRTQDPRSGVKTRRTEKVKAESTYRYQLEAFTEAVREGGPVLTPPSDSVKNMRVVDAVYRAAGLEPREPTA
jgi:predicted dehydrogenase